MTHLTDDLEGLQEHLSACGHCGGEESGPIQSWQMTDY